MKNALRDTHLPTESVHQLADTLPEQPWFVINSANHYDLIMSDDSTISHFYSFQADLSKGIAFAIPDGCIDIVFDCDQTNPAVRICGTTLEARSANLLDKHRYFGIRFSLGALPAFVDVEANQLVDHELNLLELAPEICEVFDQIVSQPVLTRQVELFRRFYTGKALRKTSELTVKVMRTICDQHGDIRVRELEDLTGYTSRTIERRFFSDIGMSPKAFSRIIRCQSAVYDISHRNKSVFSELAAEHGFSDQSHFHREFKKFVAATPVDFQRRLKQAAYQNRIRYSSHCSSLTRAAASP